MRIAALALAVLACVVLCACGGEPDASPILAGELARSGALWGTWKSRLTTTQLGPATSTYIFTQPDRVRMLFETQGDPPLSIESEGTFRITDEGVFEITSEGHVTKQLVEGHGSSLVILEPDGDRFELTRQ